MVISSSLDRSRVEGGGRDWALVHALGNRQAEMEVKYARWWSERVVVIVFFIEERQFNHTGAFRVAAGIAADHIRE